MNIPLSIQMLEIVAQGLGKLRERVVFVGGATTALYTDDAAISEPRPTDDIDCVVEVASKSAYQRLEDELRKQGFRNAVEPGAPICRWTYSGITVDVMPTRKEILGFSNRWYPEGIKNAERHALPSGTEIYVFSLPYFIASKLEAFLDRGKGQMRFSSDFEDIVHVLDGCRTAREKLEQSPKPVHAFLRAQFEDLTSNDELGEAVLAHLGLERNRGERASRILGLVRDFR